MRTHLGPILTNRKIATITSIGILCLLLSVMFIGSSLGYDPNAQEQMGDGDNQGMPGYADTITMEHNYISITQDSPTQLTVDERIGFENKGSDNYTSKLFFWSQPILGSILQFGIVINDNYTFITHKPSGSFLFVNLSESNRSIAPNESLEFVFKYTLIYPEGLEEFHFEKTFLYDTAGLIVIVKPYQDYTVEGVTGVQLSKEPTTGDYFNSHGGTSDFIMSDYIAINFNYTASTNGDDDIEDDDTDDPSTFSTRNIALIVVVAAILLVIAIFIIYRFKAGGGPQDEADEEDRAPAGSVSKPGKKKRSKSGAISKEDTRKKGLKKERDKLEGPKTGGSKNDSKTSKKIQELEVKKEAVMNAIKKLDDDRRSGIIEDDLYQDMKDTYKKKAIGLLKKIDVEKGKNS